MKYLVTGGAGFIGSHLVRQLLMEDCQVTVIDHFSMGKRENLPDDPRLTVQKASILEDIGESFRGIDVVFHLAALTRPQVSMSQPVETNLVNVEGTLRILRHCVDNKVKRLVFVSSSSLYGEQKKYPVSEDATPYPMSPYGLSKLIGEQYCKLWERLYGLESNYIRPFNVYGTRQNPLGGYAAAVPKFIDQISKGKIPMITGNGEQSRDFTYVDDVVDQIILAGKSKVFGEAFNAGAGHTVSINEIFKTVCKLMNKKVQPLYVAPVVEPKMTLADISKAKRLLGWEPKVSLEEGLKRTIEGTLAK